MTDADRVRDILKSLNLSQRGAARLLGINERTMRRWCAGDYPVPRIAILALAYLVVEKEEAASEASAG